MFVAPKFPEEIIFKKIQKEKYSTVRKNSDSEDKSFTVVPSPQGFLNL